MYNLIYNYIKKISNKIKILGYNINIITFIEKEIIS